jgi:hypothetical protein
MMNEGRRPLNNERTGRSARKAFVLWKENLRSIQALRSLMSKKNEQASKYFGEDVVKCTVLCYRGHNVALGSRSDISELSSWT